MKKSVLFSLLITMLMFSCSKQKKNTELALPSPDVKNHLYFNLNNGEPWYLFYHNSEIIVDWSQLGVVLQDQVNYTEGLYFIKSESRSVQAGLSIVLSDGTILKSPYNEMIVFLSKPDDSQHQFRIIFRAYNDGFTFAYDFERTEGTGMVQMVTEETEFNFYDKSAKWVVKQAGQNDSILPGGPTSEDIHLPVELVSESGTRVTINESKIDNYPEMMLVKRNPLKPEFKCRLNFSSEVQTSINPGIGSSVRVILISQDNSINHDIK